MCSMCITHGVCTSLKFVIALELGELVFIRSGVCLAARVRAITEHCTASQELLFRFISRNYLGPGMEAAQTKCDSYSGGVCKHKKVFWGQLCICSDMGIYLCCVTFQMNLSSRDLFASHLGMTRNNLRIPGPRISPKGASSCFAVFFLDRLHLMNIICL